MNFGSNSFYQTSYQQAYTSVGALAMVSVEQIKTDENIDYLQSLCRFIEQMNINPLWFEAEGDKNKLKVIEIYQLAITYSRNLSQHYSSEIHNLENKNKVQAEQNEQKVRQIKEQKENFRKMKDQYKVKKLKHLQNVYLRQKMKEDEAKSQNQEYPPHYPTPPFIPPYYYYPPHAPYNHPPQYTPPHYTPNQHHPPESFAPPPPYPPHPAPNGPNSNFFPGQVSTPIQQPQKSLQDQIATSLFKQFTQNGAKPEEKPNLSLKNQTKNEVINSKRVNKQLLSASAAQNGLGQTRGVILDTKKIDKSFIKDEESQNQYKNMDQSDIINKYEINDLKQSNHKPASNKERSLELPNSKKNANTSAKVEEDDFEQFGNLTAQSKRSITKQRKQSMQQGSKHSNNSMQQEQLDSIAVIRLQGKESKLQQKPFVSNIVPKGMASNNLKLNIPNAISPINQQQDIAEFQLPDNSNIQKSRFSKNSPQSNSKFFGNKPPKRASQRTEIEKESKEESDDGFDIDSINLKAISKAIPKGKKENTNQLQEFGGIEMSTKIKKGENNQNSLSAEKVYEQTPSRKSKKAHQNDHNLLKISEANSEALTQSKNKMLQSATVNVYPSNTLSPNQKNQDFNIYSSNVGARNSGSSESTEKIYSGKAPKRSSQNEKDSEGIRMSNVKTPPKLQKEQINEVKEEDDNYENQGFEQFNLLEQSHQPLSRKAQAKVEELKPQKSEVDIKVPSIQSIQEISKYHKLKGEEFKLSQKVHNTKIEVSRGIEQSADPFDDFIENIPANSTIAKPSARFQLPKKLPINFGSQPKSLRELPSEEMSEGTSKNISINLISADHERVVKLLSKQDQKDKDKENQKEKEREKQKQRQQSLVPDDDLRSSSLPISNEMMESKLIMDNASNRMLNFEKHPQSERRKEEQAKYNQPIKPIPVQVDKNEEEGSEIIDSSFEQMNLQDSQRAMRSKNKQSPQNLIQYRNKIISMIKNSQQMKPARLTADKFNNKDIDRVIENLCKINLNSQSMEKLTDANAKLELQLKKLKQKHSQRSRVLEKFIKEENILVRQASPEQQRQKQKQKPRAKPALNNDSLNYSSSYVNQKLQPKNRNPKVELRVDQKDITASIVLNNPYTPQPDDMKPDQPKKSPKATNPFLLQNNKSMGTKQQQNLLKNAGEGISKYNKDDPLQRNATQMIKMMNLRSKLEQQNEDEWD